MQNVEAVYHLSPMQQGLLFLDQYSRGSGDYVVQLRATLRGRFDEAAFRAAWRRVIEHHPVLRTAFFWEGLEQPLQVVRARVELPWRRVDWRRLEPRRAERELERWLERDLRASFDLRRAPLLRLSWLELPGGDVHFVWSHHHLVVDGWSAPEVLRQVLAAYAAFAAGRAPSLPPSRPFRDYVEWLERQDLDEAERAWRLALAGFTPAPPFGIDPDPGAGRRRGGYRTRWLRLDEAASRRAREAAGRRRVTLNTLVQGAWALLLGRYLGRDEVVFGAVVSGRPPELAGVESIVGMFVNTLPVRARLEVGRGSGDWLRGLQKAQAEMRRYEHVPLRELREWCGLGFGEELFETVVIFENTPPITAGKGRSGGGSSGASNQAGGVVELVRSGDRTGYPATLAVFPHGRLSLRLSVLAERFDDAELGRLAGHLETLLEGLVTGPEGPLGALAMLRPAERHQLLREWNDTVRGAVAADFVELFEARARELPEAVAAACGGEHLSYGELERRSGAAAAELARLGVGPEAVVAVLAERRLPLLAAILVVERAGGAWLPLDPRHPEARRRRLLETSGAALVLAEEALLEGLPAEVPCRALEPLIGGALGAAPPLAAPPLTTTADGLAYVLFTSGSTGVPKAAMVTRRGLLNHLRAKAARLGLGPADRVAQLATQSFDISVWQMLAALAVGGRVEIAVDAVAHHPERLLAWLERRRITIAQTVPSLLAGWLDALELSPAPPPALAALRALLLIGEAFPADLYRRWHRRYPEVPAHNTYGPAECADTVSHHADPRPPASGAGVPIGRPLPNLRIDLLDRRLEPVPIGLAGQLVVAGAGVGRGYLGAPARTAEVFVPDPLAGRPGGRLYRTGDLARRLADGRLDFLGRADHQVKVRGQRIELGEVEAALRAQGGVRAAAVVARGEGAGRRLVAYVVGAGGAVPPAEELRRGLGELLPEGMLPAVFVALDELPLNASGKLDRRALPEPEPAAGRPWVEPRTPFEELVAATFGELLGRERIGAHDHFFELGGHSLLAIQVSARLGEALGVELPVRRVFEAPTPAALAAELERARGAAPAVPRPHLERLERDAAGRPLGRVPLSFAQERLWLLDRLAPGGALYNIPLAVRLRGALEPARLEAALAAVVRRHEVLRTAYGEDGGEPFQEVLPSVAVALPEVDLRRARRAEGLARRLAEAEVRRPFDLGSAPPLRALLLRLDAVERVLVVTLHHVAGDGWSTGILVRELAALYAAAGAGRRFPLQPLEVQYADYAVWQRSWLAGAVLEEHLAYWRRRLAGLEALELPTDRPRPAAPSHAGGRVGLRLPAPLTERLGAVGRRRGATLFMTLLAGFQTLLARHAGQLDLAVGTPIAGRDHRAVEASIGFFANTLVLRADLEGDPSFERLLARVRESTLDAYGHQALPFERLVAELQPERDLARSPLFQVALVLQNAPLGTVEVSDELVIEPFAVAAGGAKFDLTLSLRETAAGLRGALEYDRDLFDAASIRRLGGHLAALLEALAAEPSSAVMAAPVLSAAERHQLLREWQPATAGPAPAGALHERVAAHAAAAPERVAVVAGGEHLSYGELARRAGALARRLRAAGAAPDLPVAVCVERSAELAVALLGVLESGAAYLPLDPRHPDARLAGVIEDALAGSPAALLVSTGEPARRLAELAPLGGRLLRLGPGAGDAGEAAPARGGAAPGGEHLAYVIYTSGSTGRPKGVGVTHRNAGRLFTATERLFGFGPDDAFSLFHSPAFDFSVWELWGALAHGGRVVMVPYWDSRSGDAFLELLRRERITVLSQTPSAFAQLIAAERAAPAAALALRWVVFGGEALDPALLEPWLARHGERRPRLTNMYGITETTVHASHRPLGAADLARPGRSPIGRALDDLRLLLLDPALRPVPAGVAAEIHVAGAGLARGYLGLPGRTAERFVPDPYAGRPGERLYRSGDLARFTAGGELDFLGRRDHQVKVRGHRIELGEVEAALRALEEVFEAAVVLRGEDEQRGLVAFVVTAAEPPPSAGELRRRLAGRLIEAMVPRRFVFVEALPLTANGKVDRAELARRGLGEDPAERPWTAPRTAMEGLVAETFAAVLGRGRVGADDHFFELGGHSLLAARVASRLAAALGREVPLRAIFETPAVAELARALERAHGDGAPPRPPIVPLERAADGTPLGPVPLSWAQERLWLLDRLAPGSALYNLPRVVRLRGRLETAALAAALGEVVRRHEVLRARFVESGGEPRQEIAAPAPVPLPEVDLRRLGAPEEVAERLAAAEARRPFDLERGPLLRALLLRLAGGEHALALTLHHVAVDGWSAGLLVRELSALYGAAAEGRRSPLAPLAVQYGDVAAWQRRWRSREALAGQLAYWRRRLEGAPTVLELPADRPRRARAGYRGGSVRRRLDGELTARLLELGRRRGATLFMTLLAAFDALVHRLTGRDDFLLGTPVAGRDLLETEPLIGPFLNTLVLRADVSGEPTFTELLERVRAGVLEAFAHQDVAFEQVLAELRPERDAGRGPLFQVLFNMMAASGLEPAVGGGGLEVEAFATPELDAKLDLTLYLAERGGGVDLLYAYDADLFDARRIEELADQYRLLLEAFAERPQAGVGEPSLLTPAARSLLADPGLALEPPPFASVGRRFLERAAADAAAPAVVAGGRTWSYGELAARSLALRRELAARGVGVGTAVAVRGERSPELIAAWLAALLAGGVLVPLERRWPAARQRLAAARSGARLLVQVGDDTAGEAAGFENGAGLGHGAGFEDGDVLELAVSPEDDGAFSELSAAELAERVDPARVAEPPADAPAYVFFTSGTSGEPKAVLGRHRGLAHFLEWQARTWGVGAGDRVAQLTAVGFDVVLRDVFLPLVGGAALCLPPPGLEAAEVLPWLDASGATVLHAVPSLAALWLDAAERPEHLERPRLVFFAGEPLSGELVERWRRRLVALRDVVNLYGPTETTLAKCFYRVPEPAAPGMQPVGEALPEAQALVLGPRLERRGVGEPGEVVLRTPMRSLGYLGDARETARRFRPDPFGGEAGGSLYLTGDRGRYRPDGRLELLGRLDDQVKVRGVRVEPGEVRAALERQAGVRAAAVVARADAAGEPRLVAYWVPGAGATDGRELRRRLALELPAALVPSAFVALEALPLTANGKIDRRALPAPELPAERPFEAPRGPLEEVLAGLFAELLGAERVGAEDDFFELGGHSLLALRLGARVREHLGVELPLPAVFEAPTVAALARRLEPELGAAGAAAPIERAPRDRPSALSYAQERLWFLDQLQAGDAAYNVPLAVRLRGPLRPEVLERALLEVVSRHEVLRTRFVLRDGEPVQEVSADPRRALPRVDLGRLARGRREAEARELARRLSRRPFDLQRAAPWRWALIVLGPRHHLASLTLHHVLTDAWSMGVLVRELSVLYRAFVRSRPSPLEPLELQYADYAAWQRRHLDAATLAAEVDHWRRRLAGLPRLELPTDRPHAGALGSAGGRWRFALPRALGERLETLARARGASLFMVLMAGFQALLSRYSSQFDFAVGTPIAGRGERRLEGLVGFFVNMLVIRLDLAGNPGFEGLLERVRERSLEAYAHRELPFEKLVGELQPGRQAGATPFFRTVFAHNQAVLRRLETEGLGFEPLALDNGTAKFDLTLIVDGDGRGLEATFEYSRGLFDRSTIGRAAGHLATLLEGLVAEPERGFGYLPLLRRSERAQMLREWNDTEKPCSQRPMVHELFAEHARERPERVAVVADAGHLSYGELDRRSNRLAHRLRALGVGPEVLVVLATDRTLERVVATFAVIKAGGAYVSLDARHPRERLAFLLEDVAAPVVLTESPYRDLLPATEAAVICLDADEAEGGAAEAWPDDRPPASGVTPENLAYVVYTSGSTGQPKGVEIPHAGLMNMVWWHRDLYSVSWRDHSTQVASPAFDASIWELWPYLTAGATSHVPNEETRLSSPGMIRWWSREGITLAYLMTPLAEGVLEEEIPPHLPLRTRALIIGGDRLHQGPRPEVGFRLMNHYGPAEYTIVCTVVEVPPRGQGHGVPTIGRAIDNTAIYLLDRRLEPVPTGVVGELYLGGIGIARGYLRRPALTAERFLPDPFSEVAGERLYRTGDLVRYLTDGDMDFLGRLDHQVKVRGYRLELGEIESALVEHPGVAEALVLVREDAPGAKRLVAYLTAARASSPPEEAELRGFLRRSLPDYMVPSAFAFLSAFPMTPNGKVDRRALPPPERLAAAEEATSAVPRSRLERRIAAIWCQLLGLERVSVDDSFFDLGGHSLLLVKLRERLNEELELDEPLPLVDLFRLPTVRAIAEHLGGRVEERPAAAAVRPDPAVSGEVAVVGMALRVPGADSPEAFWRNLADGVESIARFSDRELIEAGVPRRLLDDPAYVKARGYLPDIDLFDADFFAYTPRQAELMDPQQRVFMELAWQGLEEAGYDPARPGGPVGVFAGVGTNAYVWRHLIAHPELLAAVGGIQAQVANEKDHLATQVSYKLGLTGPSLTVQTACSTSLVAVILACQSLLGGLCRTALAGGVSIRSLGKGGYRYEEGSIASPDGRCRAFDARARGTVGGDGAGVVVLKRLEDAVADGDAIRAVIKGFGLNNDGSVKVGYTAPGVEGQAAAIRAAHEMAGVEARSIRYVEAHGTGTPLGDPIEVEALRRAFRAGGVEEGGGCALGSVKTNIGHLDTASGVAGLIKTVLALEHRRLPPSLHFERANPKIDFARSPFHVNAELADWPAGEGPLRAGVSSFGIGGTNAHVVVEEAPATEPSGPARAHQLLLVSARSESALEHATERLAAHLRARPDVPLADVAYTLQVGRRGFAWRRACVAADAGEAARRLESRERGAVATRRAEPGERGVVFLFPGQGAQRPGMTEGLYRSEPRFREEVDRAAEILEPHLGLDLRRELYPAGDPEAAAARLADTRLAQPALFVVEHALARLLISWGVRPSAMLGHSLGEYVAACLAGVLSLEQALVLVAERGRLMAELPPGAMLGVECPAAELEELLGPTLALAADNAPERSVASGPAAAIEELAARLDERGVGHRRLRTSHAFHSPMMEPVLAPFAEALAGVDLRPPKVPYLSNLTGDWITAEQVADPAYWSEHLRRPVRFGPAVERLLAEDGEGAAAADVFLEVGPGRALASLCRRRLPAARRGAVLACLEPRGELGSETAGLLAALGGLWLAGVEPDWRAFYGGEHRRRVSLPTYPFERRRYWLEAPSTGSAAGRARPAAEAAEAAGAPIEPRHHRPELETAYAPPEGAVEERLAAIWCALLGLERVGAEDDFFELGGDSLLASRVLSQVRAQLEVEVPVRELFEQPTVRTLGARVEALRRGGERAETIPRLPRDGELPLSYAQERLWFLDRLQPGSSAYNMPMAIRLTGALRPRELAGALGDVVRRHEVLRVTFAERGGRPLLEIHPPGPFALAAVDLGGLAAADREGERERLAAAEADRPFDLTRDPMLRATLVRLGAEEHDLLLTIHHVASDGWSMGVLRREIGELYRARVEGREPTLPELEVQYADYAAWQRRWLEGEVLRAELDWWRRRLAGLPPLLELPTDRPRAALRRPRARYLRARLPRSLSAAVAGLSRRRGATLFMTLLAALEALLHRYTGAEDLAVGTPVAGRHRLEVEPLIGFFVNTLVIRGELAGEPSFVELLERARETTLAVQDHRELPFEKLVEELEPERSLSYSPLFQVLFALQNVPGDERAESRAEHEGAMIAEQAAKFDLSLFASERAGGLALVVEYAGDLFDATTVARLLGHYRRLLEAAVERPKLPVGRLSILGAGERAQLVRELNDTRAEPEARGSWPELFAERARLAPDAVAAVSAGEHLSYRELERRSAALARRLAGLGAGPERVVALLAERHLPLLVAVAGVLRAGAAYLPLDPRHPAARHRQLLAASAAGWVLAAEELLEGGAVSAGTTSAGGGASPRWLALEPLIDGVASSGGGPLRAADPEGLAYVFYTSGSTGAPKGAMVMQGGMVNHLWAKVRDLGLGAGDAVAQTASQCFDVSVWQMLAPLVVGGRVEIAGDAVVHHPERQLDWLEHRRLSVFETVPSLLAGLLDRLEAGPRPELAALRWLLVTGEAYASDLCRRWHRLFPAVPTLNAYGPTECSDDVAHHAARRPPLAGAEVPIGRPVVNTRLYLLDRRLELAPLGVPGELFAGGAGVGRGYLGDPARTAEAFVPDPLGGEAGARLYRTGDLARWRPGVGLDFLGRLDHQVKVRGHRIELGEVEAALRAEPEVRAAVVVARGEGAGRRLVAYAVPAEGSSLDAETLRRRLGERLPAAMVPAVFVTLEALPLTANRKVDRRALPEPEAPAAVEKTAPRTPIEELVAGLYGELLDAAEVGAEDHFFELGGHSLLATQLSSRLGEALGVELPVRKVFESPAVAGLAAELERLRRRGEGPARPPIQPLERDARGLPLEPPPLSFAQERLWFLDRLMPGTALYNVPLAVVLRGRLEKAALGAALEEVVRRHEVLRTRLAEVEGTPYQHISPPASRPLLEVDLRALAAPAVAETGRRLAGALARRSFDLAGEWPWRACLLGLGAEEHALVLVVHHVASDGWSTGILVRELAALYGAACAGRPSPLAAPPVQYADFAAWQRGWLRGETLAAQLAYWRRRLAGVPALELPTDRPRPPVQSVAGATLDVVFEPALVERLKGLGRRRDATLFMVVLAAFQALLGRWAGAGDVAVGTPIAGRDHRSIEGLIGFFVNTLVLRADLAAAPHFADLLAQVRELTLDAYAHQAIPFERLVAELSPERDRARSPLFQVMLMLQYAQPGGGELPGLALEPMRIGSDTAKFDLTLNLQEAGGGLLGTFEYASELFDATTVRRLGGHLRQLLAAVAGDPELPLAAAPLGSPAERHQLRREWNDTGAPLGSERRIEGLLRRRAAEVPEAVAVVAGDTALSYGELHRRSACLARRLRAAGAAGGIGGTAGERPVGLALERSAEMLVALVAVLEAGAAYVPLDPAYPDARLGAMAGDAGLELVVTTGHLAERLAGRLGEPGPSLLLLDAPAAAEVAGEPPAAPAAPSADGLAYLIYTSGSTGRPKGIEVPHRTVAAFLEAMARRPGLGRDEVLLAVTTLAFDIAVLELLLPLVAGARVVVAERRAAYDGAHLAAELERHRAGALQATPTTWQLLLAAGGEGWSRRRRLRALCGGEALPGELARALVPRTAELWNLYGPTETTVWSALHRVEGAPGSVPIGRPISGTELHVLDRGGRPAALGVPGELAIGGAGVVRGYHRRAGQTAERFVPDALGGRPGARLYRTGDLVRRLGTGELAFLGRLDHQVKLRGFRIELGEVEAVAGRHPAVREVAAVVGGAGDERRLCAFVVPRGADPALGGLREHLRERLPEYMVPAAVVALEALPRLPNGKVDRAELSRRAARLEVAAASEGAGARPSAPPRTPFEELVADVYAEVLGLERVAAGDHFFTLGGHSLLAARVGARLSAALGVEVPLGALFEHPTVEELAAVLERTVAEGRTPPPPLRRLAADEGGEDGEGGEVPLSFAQRRLWLAEQLRPGRPIFNIPRAVRLRGELRPEVLEAALGEVVRRHRVLRTRFEPAGDEARQVVVPAAPFVLPRIDLARLDPETRDRLCRRLLAAEVARPFRLDRAPLLRARLLRLAPGEHLFHVTIHHIAADARSLDLLVAELAALYGAFAAGRPSPLAEPAIQYADYARWQREWLQGAVLEEHLGYWRRQLSALEPRVLPVDREAPAERSHRGRSLRFRLPAELSEPLRRLGREQRVSRFMTLLAAFYAVLHRVSGRRDVVVGADLAGRGRRELEDLVGFFINMLVLRADLGGDPSFAELLARVRAVVLGAFAHQEVPYERLVAELGAGRAAGGEGALFQVVLNYNPVAGLRPDGNGAQEAAAGPSFQPYPTDSPWVRFDLMLVVFDGGERIEGAWVYSSELFDDRTVEQLDRRFRHLLASAVEHPDTPIGELEMESPEERAERRRGADSERRRRLFEVEPKMVEL